MESQKPDPHFIQSADLFQDMSKSALEEISRAAGKHSAADDLIAKIHDCWPESIPVFHAHQMKCVGCAMAGHETLAEALTIYNIQETVFLEELHLAIKGSRS